MNREIEQKRMGSSRASARELPALVKQIRDNASAELVHLLGDMFSGCDDLFFDLSSRATSNKEQNLYFESMREVRLKKASVIQAFRQELGGQFDRLMQIRPVDISGDIDADQLTLVEHEQAEQRVAVSAIVTRARNQFQEALYQLQCRLDSLLPHLTLNADNNPMDPAQVANAFSSAAATMDLDIKARIILFKQFERAVSNQLGRIYDAANQHLINAGILPKIRPAGKQSSSAGKPEASHPQASPAHISSGLENATVSLTFNELSGLLASLRSSGGVLPIAVIPPGYAPTGPALPATELQHLLSEAQLSSDLQAGAAQGYVGVREAVNYIVRQQQATGAPRGFAQVDEDVINLVAMFFDFVLSDKNLPVPIQALIGRLQIPVLRMALRDKTFFSTGNHPARRMINDIANAGIGWNEADKQTQDLLYQRLSTIVQKVHDEYGSNEQVFEQALAELGTFVEQESRKASLVETRTSEAAAGQAKAAHARYVVQRLLNERLDGQQVPHMVVDFLFKEWQNVMFLVYLKEGEDSQEWLDIVQAVDDLVWSSQPHQDAKSHARQQALLPSLREKLLQGMEVAAIPREHIDARLSELAMMHQRLLLGEAETVAAQTFKPDPATSVAHPSGKSWKEMTALERQQVQYRALTYEYIKRAEAVTVGTWMLFEDPRSGGSVRCKLAARIPESDSYVFVNRFGFKAVEKKRKEVAYDLQCGRAQVLDTTPLFDRTLDRIVSNLRRVSDAPVAH